MKFITWNRPKQIFIIPDRFTTLLSIRILYSLRLLRMTINCVGNPKNVKEETAFLHLFKIVFFLSLKRLQKFIYNLNLPLN